MLSRSDWATVSNTARVLDVADLNSLPQQFSFLARKLYQTLDWQGCQDLQGHYDRCSPPWVVELLIKPSLVVSWIYLSNSSFWVDLKTGFRRPFATLVDLHYSKSLSARCRYIWCATWNQNVPEIDIVWNHEGQQLFCSWPFLVTWKSSRLYLHGLIEWPRLCGLDLPGCRKPGPSTDPHIYLSRVISRVYCQPGDGRSVDARKGHEPWSLQLLNSSLRRMQFARGQIGALGHEMPRSQSNSGGPSDTFACGQSILRTLFHMLLQMFHRLSGYYEHSLRNTCCTGLNAWVSGELEKLA